VTAPTVYTLVVDCGRRPGDGLPEGASGARLLCHVAAGSEAEAVQAAVAVLREAGLAPLDVTGYGSLEERLAAGAIEPEERALIDRAAAEGDVIVAELTPRFEPDAAGEER
jgi:hypothetical protein